MDALHPIDRALRTVVTLAFRRQPQDLIDTIFAAENILPCPALVWAAVASDPGLNPASLLEHLRRRTLTPEDAAYIQVHSEYSVQEVAQRYRRMLAATDAFIAANTQRAPGALLQDRRTGKFFLPQSEDDWEHTLSLRMY